MLMPEGRVVMVSGAGRGLGAAIARQLHEDGFVVSLGARRPAMLEVLTADWSDESDDGGASGEFSIHQFDAFDPESQRRWVASTLTEHGRIDGLVNNAATFHEFDLSGFQEEHLDDMWTVNVKTPARLVHLALGALRASGHGRVVNIASLSGKRVSGSFAPGYAMTKHALVALTHNIRQEFWADGLRATAICPSFVDTDMIADLDPGPEPIIDPADLAMLVSTTLQLPNHASVAELVVHCRAEPLY